MCACSHPLPGSPLAYCAYRKPRLAHYGSRRAHVTCYTASLHLVDFKCASSFGDAQLTNALAVTIKLLVKSRLIRLSAAAALLWGADVSTTITELFAVRLA